jgi:hypothetical protein
MESICDTQGVISNEGEMQFMPLKIARLDYLMNIKMIYGCTLNL